MISKDIFNGVSVIVPILNEENTVLQLVQRIDVQLRKRCPYEIIFVDDYSDDNTESEIKKLLSKYPISFYKK